MIYKSCSTCLHFSENMLSEEDKSYKAHSNWCAHPLSAGARTSTEMIFNGECGRDLKLWERYKYHEFEVYNESM